MARKISKNFTLSNIQAISLSECPECLASVGQKCVFDNISTKSVHPSRVVEARIKIRIALRPTPSLNNKIDIKPKPKKKSKRDPFYSSWEWKELRFDAIKLHGRKCQCCGWTPDGGISGHIVVDHIKPRRKFPELELDINNLQVLCNDCNMGKGSRHIDDFRISRLGR